MAANSPNGYLAAIVIRSNRTLLVEGRRDKRVISRLLNDLCVERLLNEDDVLIDTAEEIKNNPGQRLGNREKVEQIYALVTPPTHKFAAFVDRDFRGFDLGGLIDTIAGHRTIPNTLFWSRGHSIENYFFSPRHVLTYLDQQIPEHLTVPLRQQIANQFNEMILGAATISLAALSTNILERADGMARIDHWRAESTGDIVVNLPLVEQALQARGVNPATIQAFDLAFHHYSIALRRADPVLPQWICHGHTGHSYIWAAVAFLLRREAVDPTVVDEIAYGGNDNKYRTCAGPWAGDCIAGARDTPMEFVAWLRGP
jgi:hypothetical protein